MKGILKSTFVLLLLLISQFVDYGHDAITPAYAALDCNAAGIICKSGPLASNETWTPANTYVITGDVTVLAGQTLTLQPGTIVKFQEAFSTTPRRDLLVDGTLIISGQASNKVYFTSLRDDLGGDTNSDGAASAPVAGDWGSIQFRPGSSGTISHAEVRYAGRKTSIDSVIGAIYLEDSSPTIAHLTVRHALWAAISAKPSDRPTITNFAASNTPLGGLEIRSDTLTTNATWANVGIAYIIDGDLTIDRGATLTINPGVMVKFEQAFSTTPRNDLLVDGTLLVKGQADNKVYFTSLRDDLGGDTNNNGAATAPTAGDWGSIQFRPGSSGNISQAEIRYAGRKTSIDSLIGAIYLEGSSPVIHHLTVRHALGSAISALPTDTPTITNFTATNTPLGGLEIRGSALTTPATWRLTGIAYILSRDFTVASGGNLTLNPGVVVKFAYNILASSKIDLIVENGGVLTVNGAANDKVYFTSLRDDTVPANNKGDTNGDGGATAPAPGDWKSIQFKNGSSGNINHAEIRYGGNGNNNGAIHVASASPTISNSLWRNNTVGLYSSGAGAAPVVSQSDLYYNSQYAMLATDNATVQATNNWWGDSGGPNNGGSNPAGEAIGGNVVFAGPSEVPFQFKATPPVIFASVLANNTVGLYSSVSVSNEPLTLVNSASATGPTLRRSIVQNNTQYGVFAAANSLVTALENWWGHPNGPTTNGLSAGDRISDQVLYIPWCLDPLCTDPGGDGEGAKKVFLPLVLK